MFSLLLASQASRQRSPSKTSHRRVLTRSSQSAQASTKFAEGSRKTDPFLGPVLPAVSLFNLCEGESGRRRRRYSPCSRRCAGLTWRSGCRAQSTARSAGGGRKRRRQERTGGNRRGEATQGSALIGDYGDEMTRLRS